jgi:hypothetical protein
MNASFTARREISAKLTTFFVCFVSILIFTRTKAQVNDTLAKLVQNKVANLLQLPFQNNMDVGIGPSNACVTL